MTKQLFEYLLTVNKLCFKVIRDYKEYEKTWSKSSLEEYREGVYVMGEGEEEDAILEIHRKNRSGCR